MKGLMVSDFDGTLYNDEGVTEEYVKEAIRSFNSSGGYFTVCTGRAYQGFHSFDGSFMNAPALLANGAMAYDYAKRELVFFDGIGDEAADMINDIFNLFPSVSVELYGYPKLCCLHLNEQSRRHFDVLKVNDYGELSSPLEAKPPFAKIMLGTQTPEVSREVQYFLKIKHPGMYFIETDCPWVEVLKYGVNKGTGMLKLAGVLGIPQENTASVGDGDNDVDMHIRAAFSYAPENAGERAKAAAKYLMPSNNDGCVKYAAEHFMNALLKEDKI